MIDARYEAARRTDQSGQRGWDFDPSSDPGFRPSFVMVVVAVIVVAGSLLGMIL